MRFTNSTAYLLRAAHQVKLNAELPPDGEVTNPTAFSSARTDHVCSTAPIRIRMLFTNSTAYLLRAAHR